MLVTVAATVLMCAIGLPYAVAAVAAPANDDFANAVVLSGLSVSQAGTNLEATVEAGEPQTGGSLRPQSVWYRWTAPYASNIRIDTCAATAGDSFIGVYTGATLPALTEVASADEGCGGAAGPSRVTFWAEQGVQYAINVATPSGTGAGDFTLSLASAPIMIEGAQLSGTAFVGQPLSLTNGSWIGLAPMTYSYSWHRFSSDGSYETTVVSGGDSVYTLTAADVGKRMNGNVQATNAVGSVTGGGPLSAIVDFDTDGDGIGDTTDDDDDGDGLTDVEEVAAGTDRLKPDTDGDGLIDKFDPCPLNATYNNRLCGPLPPEPMTPAGAESATVDLPRRTLTATKDGKVNLKGGAVSTLPASGGGAASAAYAVTGRMTTQLPPKKKGARKKRLTLASSAFTLGYGESKPIEFQLTRTGRAALKKARKLQVTITMTVIAPDGSSLKSERRYLLKGGVPVR